jgi:surface protein
VCAPGFDPECPVSQASSAQSNNYRNYEALGEDISQWDTSGITDMSYMFEGENDFNIDISGWDTSNVTDMSYMFSAALSFNQDISGWNVSNVTNMQNMFFSADSFQGDLNLWDVSNVTDMSFMFAGSFYNGNISGWNLASLSDATEMFSYVIRTADIADWTFPQGVTLVEMFKGADMTGQLTSWDVSGVVDMFGMFADSATFNQDLSGWDVSNVTDALFFDRGTTSWVLPKPRFLDIYRYDLLTYGAGTWLAAGTVTDIKLGTDEVDFRRSTNGGTTWSKAGSPGQNPDNQWMSVAFGNGNWVAVSRSGTNRVVYSTDGGVTWRNAQVPGGDSADWVDVAYGDGVWVAVSPTAARAIRSTDGGATWSEVALPSAIGPRSAAYGDGVWIVAADGAGGISGVFFRSTDGGLTWETVLASDNDRRLIEVAFGGGVWLGIEFNFPSDSRVIRSTDGGVSWSDTSGTIPRFTRRLIYGNGLWRTDYSAVHRSSDGGLTWSPEDSLEMVTAVGFGGGKWLANTTNGFIEVSTTP